jgi:hypothetical protein
MPWPAVHPAILAHGGQCRGFDSLTYNAAQHDAQVTAHGAHRITTCRSDTARVGQGHSARRRVVDSGVMSVGNVSSRLDWAWGSGTDGTTSHGKASHDQTTSCYPVHRPGAPSRWPAVWAA